MKTRLVTAVATAAALGMIVTGCTTTGTDAGASPTTDTIRMATFADPSTFNPAKGKSVDDYMFARFLYDTVVRRADNNVIVSGLASDWEVTPTSASFTIRDDATCSDGAPVTADMVADSLTMFADPETASAFKNLVFGPGAPTISAEGSTVNIDLAQPWADLLPGLSLSQAGIVCTPGLQDLEALTTGVEGAYSGPYVIDEVQRGQQYSLTLRDDYSAWPDYIVAMDGVAPTNIVVQIASDATTISNELLTDELDIAPVSASEVPRFDGNDRYSKLQVVFGSGMVLFNEREGSVFADKKLRVAVAQALQRDAFNAATSQGTGQLVDSVASKSVACVLQDESGLQPYDPEAAKDVLAGVAFTAVGSNAVGPNGAGNVYLEEALRAVGADIQMDNVDNATWATRVFQQQSTWDFMVLTDVNNIGTLTNPITRIVGPLMEDGGRNLGGADNAEAVSALADAMAATTEAEACDAWERAQRAILKNVDVVPLATLENTFIQRAGFSISALSGIVDYSTVRILK